MPTPAPRITLVTDPSKVARSSLQTRSSLLRRLKNWGDGDSWQQFVQTYGDLIQRVARRSGLTPAEAQDVLQETLLSVARHMDQFKYDRTRGSFKAWLLTVTRRRIVDQFRKRSPGLAGSSPGAGDSRRTRTVERLADPAKPALETLWDREWRDNLLAVAMERVKSQVRPRQFQIFELLINREWSATQVAQSLGVSLGQVYVVKHRVGQLLKRELRRLQAQPL